MTKKVIIGAGPAGLYTAIKLRKKGIIDVVVYDPREGNYTRPGHLNSDVFDKAQTGIDTNFWSSGKIGHIRDLERALYAEAKKLGIKIEKKRFVRLYEDPKGPGVVVVDSNGEEEIIEADYVFDCTGTKREVVASVNTIIPDSPLQLTTITDLPVRKHFLAYVNMDHFEWKRLELRSQLIKDFPEKVDAISYAQSIIKLRELGWKEFKFPRCYGMEFGKNKICIYFQAPDNLAKDSYDKWVQTVMECYTKPITYTKIGKPNKPYFLAFPASAQALKEVSFKGKNLPTVITLGDAQIDFDYALAHGIRDGMDRIDALFKHMVIFDNKIYYFDSVEYQETITNLLKEHKEAVIEAAKRTKKSFITALDMAQLKFRQAALSASSVEQLILTRISKEIESRQNYEKACEIFAQCHNEKTNQVVLTFANLEKVIVNLNLIHSCLFKAHTDLPASFAIERNKIEQLFFHLAQSWKEVGSLLFKNKEIDRAIEAYKKALEIYNMEPFVHKHHTNELTLYSNLAIGYSAKKQYSEAISAANTALSIFDSFSEALSDKIQEKIIYNLIKATCAQAQMFLDLKNPKNAKKLHMQAASIVADHESKLTVETFKSIKLIIDELQARIPSKLANSDTTDSFAVSNRENKTPVSDSLGVLGIFDSLPLKSGSNNELAPSNSNQYR